MSEQHPNSFTIQQQQAYEQVNQYLLNALDALPFSDLPLAAAMKHGALLGGNAYARF